MTTLHLIGTAVRCTWRRPMQSLVVGFAWCAAFTATLVIMGVLQGMRTQVRRDMEAIGANVINIHVPPSLRYLLNSPLTIDDRYTIERSSGGPAVPFHVSLARVSSGQRSTSALLLFTEPDWQNVVPVELVEGRFLGPHDSQACVLDAAVAVQLFGSRPESGPWAVGKQITILGPERSGRFEVVGVVRDPYRIRERMYELDFGATSRPTIFRIMEYHSVYLLPPRPWHRLVIHGFVTKVPEGSDVLEREDAIFNRLADRHKLVWVWARQRWIQSVLKAVELSTEVANVGWIIVLAICTAMVFSITLVIVRSRREEVAIRRTEGALVSHLVIQFLVEHFAVAAAAFVAALALTHWAAPLLEWRYLSWPVVLDRTDVWSAALAGSVAVVVATAGPTIRTAMLDPATVLAAGREL